MERNGWASSRPGLVRICGKKKKKNRAKKTDGRFWPFPGNAQKTKSKSIVQLRWFFSHSCVTASVKSHAFWGGFDNARNKFSISAKFFFLFYFCFIFPLCVCVCCFGHSRCVGKRAVGNSPRNKTQKNLKQRNEEIKKHWEVPFGWFLEWMEAGENKPGKHRFSRPIFIWDSFCARFVCVRWVYS